MNPQVVLPLIAGSCLDVAQKDFSAHSQFQARSDAVPVTFGSHGADQKGIVAITAVVTEQIGSLTIVADQDIQIAIVIQIAHRERAADLLQCESGPGGWADIMEFSGPVILQQKVALFVGGV